MKYKAYAKINLCINNLGINSYGYHNLDMIVAQINLYDYLYITKIDNGCVIEGMEIPQEDNLMYRAYIEYKKKYDFDFGLKIKIEKNIPSEAGLGGGSSDAATVITALNEMNNNHFTKKELLEIANCVGSDVSYFIYGGICRVQGTGKIVTPISDKILDNLILIKPNYGLSTKEIYDHSNEYEFERKKTIIENNIEKIKNNSFSIELFNDLEIPALDISSKYTKSIGYYKKLLKDNKASKVLMTGSGSCIFGMCEKSDIDSIYLRILKQCNNEWVAKI